jgi:hypothetical protein
MGKYNKFFSQFRLIHTPIIQHGKGQNHHLGLSTHGDWTAGGCRQGCTYWDPYYVTAKIKSPYFGWWFGTWIIFFHILGINSNPNWQTHIFQGGGSTTNQFWLVKNCHFALVHHGPPVFLRAKCVQDAESRIAQFCDSLTRPFFPQYATGPIPPRMKGEGSNPYYMLLPKRSQPPFTIQKME